jgi:predicted O-methyltransferase YrrM
VVHEWFWGLKEPPVGKAYFEASERIAAIPGGMFIPTELYESLKYIFDADIPGDIVEYGVWKGRSLYFIAWLTQKLSKRPRKILGFDTFAGFGDSASDANDHFMGSAFAKHSKYARLSGDSKIYTDTSREAVAHLMRDFDNVELVEGDIRDTISTVEGRQLALAFFDMDDYSPTAAALEMTYQSLQPGGVMIHDHFSTPTLLRGACYGQRIAMKKFLATHPMFTLCNSNTFLKPPHS